MNIKTKNLNQKNEKHFNAFIDFYNQYNVIPVSQDIEQIKEFIFRRNYLYTRLGSPLSYFTNKTLIEFGPGGGFNAIATSANKPALYVFVDASKASLEKLQYYNDAGKFNSEKVEIINSNIYDYSDSRKYDYVIVEGAICGQAEPDRMLKHVSTFVKNGGTLITTTTSATSVLSELCRKLFKVKIEETYSDFDSQVSLGRLVFKDHLASLKASTRPIDDWVIDMILNDWHKGVYTFTLVDAIEAIGQEFDFYNSSPSFVTDDRWYKNVTENSEPLNSIVIKQYERISSGFIDYRIYLNPYFKETNNFDEIESLSKSLCDIHDEILDNKNYDRLSDFFNILLEISKSLPLDFAPTKLSIKDFIDNFPRFIENPKNINFSDFCNWWGRGQQYISFIKKY